MGSYNEYCVAINWFITANTVVANTSGGGSIATLVSSSSGVLPNVPIAVEFGNNEIVARQNEVVIGRLSKTRVESTSLNLFLCRGEGYYVENSPDRGNRFYSFYAKFGELGQEEELDLIPVVATFDGVQEVCFYNRAYTLDGKNGLEFYRNAGSGAFLAGPDVT